MTGLTLAQHCGPQRGARARVQGHHGRGHQAGVLLPQSQSRIQAGAVLQLQQLEQVLGLLVADRLTWITE